MFFEWFRRHFVSRSSRRPSSVARRPRIVKPSVETLEDRCVPTISAALVHDIHLGPTGSSPTELAAVG